MGGLGAVTLLTGQGKHHFETSAGAFLGVEPATSYYSRESFVIPLFDLGYRFQKPGKGFIFRGKVGTLGLGIGLGYAF